MVLFVFIDFSILMVFKVTRNSERRIWAKKGAQTHKAACQRAACCCRWAAAPLFTRRGASLDSTTALGKMWVCMWQNTLILDFQSWLNPRVYLKNFIASNDELNTEYSFLEKNMLKKTPCKIKLVLFVLICYYYSQIRFSFAIYIENDLKGNCFFHGKFFHLLRYMVI